MRSLFLSSVFLAAGVAALAAPPVPRPAKPLDIVEPSGKHDLLTNLKGKVVVVQFLSTTCPHCQAYSQLLTKLQGEYGPKGFQALGAAFNEATNDMVKEYIAKYATGFPVGPMDRNTVLGFLGFSVMDQVYVPQIAIVDRKGQIREQTEPKSEGPSPLQIEAHLRMMIEKLLAEPAAAAASKSGAAVPQKGPATVAATK
jgi:thiol-disulfide isomerase/thioredoxin